MSDKMILSLKIVWKTVPDNINTNLLKRMANKIALDFDNGIKVSAKKRTVKHVLVQAIALMKDIPVKTDENQVSIASNVKVPELQEA